MSENVTSEDMFKLEYVKKQTNQKAPKCLPKDKYSEIISNIKSAHGETGHFLVVFFDISDNP